MKNIFYRKMRNLQDFIYYLFSVLIIIFCTWTVPAGETASAVRPSVPVNTKKLSPGPLIPFPAGTILSVQVSNRKPEIQDIDPRDPIPQDVAFVEVQAVLDADRGTGRFDYVLSVKNKSYACAAVALGNSSYSMNPIYWNISREKEKRRIRFLFPVHKELINQKQIKEAVLLFDLRKNPKNDVVLPLMFLPDGQTFDPAEQIPDTGICGMAFEEWQQQQSKLSKQNFTETE